MIITIIIISMKVLKFETFVELFYDQVLDCMYIHYYTNFAIII